MCLGGSRCLIIRFDFPPESRPQSHRGSFWVQGAASIEVGSGQRSFSSGPAVRDESVVDSWSPETELESPRLRRCQPYRGRTVDAPGPGPTRDLCAQLLICRVYEEGPTAQSDFITPDEGTRCNTPDACACACACAHALCNASGFRFGSWSWHLHVPSKLSSLLPGSGWCDSAGPSARHVRMAAERWGNSCRHTDGGHRRSCRRHQGSWWSWASLPVDP